MGYDFTAVEFSIFLLILAWALQQCSATALPVIYKQCSSSSSRSLKETSESPTSYLHNLISLQPPRSTRSSSVVTLSHPQTISLKITDRSFRYASPCLWNQLPDSFRQPHHSCLNSPPHPLINSSLSSSTLSSSITPSLFHSRLKTYLFYKSFPP